MGMHLPREVAEGLLAVINDDHAFADRIGEAIRAGHLGKVRAANLIIARNERRAKLTRKLNNVVRFTQRTLKETQDE